MINWPSLFALIGCAVPLGAALITVMRWMISWQFAGFENRLLERLNGRYLKADIAEELIKRSDERHTQNRANIEDIYRLLECKRTR